MTRLRNIWALAAVSAASMGIALSLLLGGAFGTAAATGASPEATTPTSAAQIFGCRASVARVSAGGSVLAEPAVANAPTSPCADSSALVQQANLVGISSAIPSFGSVGPAGASTFETGAGDSADGAQATSVADVTGLSLDLPGNFVLTAAGPLVAQAAAECNTDGSLSTQVTAPPKSDLVTLSGPGLPAGGETLDLSDLTSQIPAALSALLSIQTDVTTVTATSTTEQVLVVNLLGSAAQLVVGEATVTYDGANACSPAGPVTLPGTTTPGGTTTIVEPGGTVPGGLQECTSGSVYDPTTGNCVITYNGQTIFVSLPFQGPQGGTVVPLPVARAKYHSPCLSGPGLNYAYVVTKSHEKVLGTYLSDRILIFGSNDNTDALAGNDCVDGIATTQRIIDGNGNDRDYVTKGTNRVLVGNGRDLTTARGGNDRLISGNGPNTIHGGTGRDWITDGDGNDHIYASSGYTRIDAYGNLKHIYGGKAKDRIWTNSVRAYISCTKHNGSTVYARKVQLQYAGKHGCQVLHILH